MILKTRAATSNIKAVIINKYLIPFPLHLRDLNFNENIGILLTNRKERVNDTAGIKYVVLNKPSKRVLYVEKCINMQISKALAGVGSPIKFSLCLVSTLNLASLNAEAMVIETGTNIRNSKKSVSVLPDI